MNRSIPLSSDDFVVEVDSEGVAHIVLGHAERMPSFSASGHAEISAIWPMLAQASDVRSILIRSIGKGFCAGGAWELTAELVQEHDTRLRVMRESRALVQGMLDCDKPIVSAINGAAVGAGSALALLADISIAARGAKILDGHTRIGVAAGDHAALIWPLLCGLAKAKLHLLLGDPLSGEEAERIGLVSLCVDSSALESVAADVARRLARGSPEALQFTKRSLNHWLRAAWPGFEHSLALEVLAFGGAGAREGIAAAREKRPPQF
jgi:enoyl-CoA hydratase